MSNFSKQIFNSNNQGSNGQEIGNSVAFNADGTVMAVGFSETSLIGGGSVRIYNYISNQWETGATYTGESADDEFGYSVDLNDTGDVCIIGAPGAGTGTVYVVGYEAGVWDINKSSFSKVGTNRLGTSVSVQGTLFDPYIFASEPTASNNIGNVIRLNHNES